jgi:hypothetical protein
MDFLRIIQSLEELLYEVMTWLVFYPRTLWRSIRHPIKLLHYSDRELKDAPDDQFTDLLSPPLFLFLTILLSHLIEVAFHQSLPKVTTKLGEQIMASDENLLILRATLFSIYPLSFAVMRLNRQKTPLNRATLRQPFFAQCYIAGPAALLLGIASLLMRASQPSLILTGATLALLTITCYLRIEIIWLRTRTTVKRMTGFCAVMGTWLIATLINAGASFLILGASGAA